MTEPSNLDTPPSLYPSPRQVMEIFNGRCPRCRRVAIEVHELEPRSRGRKSMAMQNRVAVDRICHDEFHRIGATQANISAWEEYIQSYLTNTGRWEEYKYWGIENA